MVAGQFLDLNGMDSDNVMEILERKCGEMAKCSAVCRGAAGLDLGGGAGGAEEVREGGGGAVPGGGRHADGGGER